jgi:hypothetical protein
VILSLAIAAASAMAQTPPAGLRFRASAGGEFQFDTGVLRGTLRAGGKSVGLSSVVHIPTGKTVSEGEGIFSHYRVFTANHRYGPAAWAVPSEATLRDDGSVEAHWPAAENRPFEMWAVYRWSGPSTLDLETRVRPQSDLAGFESFLASYFAEQLGSSTVYVKKGRGAFVAAEDSYGQWQMSPRDQAALRLIGDGRWKYPPSPVEWAILPELAAPLGVRREGPSGITALVMAPASDCFAVSTPCQSNATHHSLYLSLFGRDIKAGETARARARLVIGTSLGDREAVKLYKAYMDFVGRKR